MADVALQILTDASYLARARLLGLLGVKLPIDCADIAQKSPYLKHGTSMSVEIFIQCVCYNVFMKP